MESTEQMVWFACLNCGSHLKSPASIAGERRPCPHCSKSVEIPAQSQALEVIQEAEPASVPAQKEQGMVPLKMTLRNLFGIETTVSQGAAKSTLQVVAGGLMVALGVMVALIFGRRPSA